MEMLTKYNGHFIYIIISCLLILFMFTSCEPLESLHESTGESTDITQQHERDKESLSEQAAFQSTADESTGLDPSIPESLNFKELLPVPVCIYYHTEGVDIAIEDPELVGSIWALLLDACDDGSPFYLCLFNLETSTFDKYDYYFTAQYNDLHTISVLAEEGVKGCIVDFDKIVFGSWKRDGVGNIIPIGSKTYCNVLAASGLGDAREKIEELLIENGMLDNILTP